MKMCTKCGTNNEDQSIYCTNCRGLLSAPADDDLGSSSRSTVSDSEAQPPYAPRPPTEPKSKAPLVVGAVIVLLIVIGIVALFFFLGAYPATARMDVIPNPAQVGQDVTVRISLTNNGNDTIEVNDIDVKERNLDTGASVDLSITPASPGWVTGTVPSGQTTVIWEMTYEVFDLQVGNYEDKITVHTNVGDFTDTCTYSFTS
ncbi:MAG: hypothetical protein JSV43_01385 [Methanobacteriota archaeon]|nr:MAG: hypothetical protein JSV43_01385 [Euryarchaeota archaeon]